MEKVVYGLIGMDRCGECKGIWFDMLEAGHLKTTKGSEIIDVGDSKKGKEYNDMKHVSCPLCHGEMIGMVDVRQPHIWYESCPTCYGIFFDDGEFTDYKEEIVLDLFRDLLSKEWN